RYPRPRLPGHSSRHPDLLVRVRAHQPDDRPRVHRPRPEDPLLSTVTASVEAAAARKRPGIFRQALRNNAVTSGGVILIVCVLIGVTAPWLGTVDPMFIDVTQRLRPPGGEHLLGTDHFGRDIYSRVLYGARISLFIGFAVAVLSIVIGTVIGLVSGYIRALDLVVMRFMDGLMAIPGILLAIALIAVTG